MRDEKLLKKAIALFPEIHETNLSAKRAIEIEKETSNIKDLKQIKEAIHIKETEISDFKNTSLKKGDSLILDFEDHYVGYLSLDLKSIGSHADAPALLKIRFAERLVEFFEDADSYNGWISSSWIQEELVHVDVIPSVLKLDRRYAFRYVRIEVMDVSSKYSLLVNDAILRAVSSADDMALVPYETENALDKEIDRVSIKTLHDCMQTVFEDGPKRDRRLWMGDLRIQAIANYETYKANDMVKSCLYLFGALTQDDGRVGACLFLEPEPCVDDTCMFDYSLFFIAALRDYFKATGDIEAVQDLWHVCKRQIELSSMCLDDRNLVRDSDKLGWCFVDWNLELNRQACAQGIFMYALKAALELSECVGDVLAQEEYSDLYLKLKEAAERFLMDKASGLFVSGENSEISMASQVWMILGGMMEGEEAARLLDKASQNESALKMITPYMYHNYIEALIIAGQKDKAHDMIDSYWGGMIENKADTFWELYNPENPDESPYGGTIVNSYCHAWSCGPTYFLRKYF